MSEPFLGEIRLVAFNFDPRRWAACNGQLLPIAQNAALFSLLGTTYGGDGRVTFALPDLRGRLPAHPSEALPQGVAVGAETVTLRPEHLPAHTHPIAANAEAAVATSPGDAGPAHTREPHYAAGGTPAPMPEGAVLPVGGNQPHDNMPPVLVMHYVIALSGIFPARA